MSNLFKKVTSAVAALSIVLSIVSPIAGVNAVYESSLEAANKLASVGVIVDNSANPANYRLGDTITRREVMKVAMNLASCQNVELNDSYAGKFSDVPSSDWAWKYAETAVDNGFIAANATFAPARDITKGEGLKMVMNVTQIEKATGGANFWADYVSAGVDADIVESFTDYDTQATRGWIFKVAANALEEGSCGADDTTDDNLLDDLLDGLDDTTDDTTTDDTTDDTTVSGDATLTIALSADTPEAATVPGNVSGLPVAAYDLTAGSEDVTVTSLTVKRKGLSDDKTLTGIAAFTADGRISKSKDDTQNNDTEALLTLTNGLVIKAGETVTVWLVADVESIDGKDDTANTSDDVRHDEFALEIVEVVASADVEADGSLVANTMKVGAVDAAELTIDTSTSVSDVTLGDEGADIFKFEIQGSSDTDIVLKSITFKSNNSDSEDNLMNFQLWFDGDEVAATAKMNDKYLTFNLGEGVTIAEDQTEKFTVTADIVAGADDDIEFYIDKTLDVSAIDTKYGYGAAVNIDNVDSSAELFDSITIEAGELTLVDIDADSDEIKEDKDDVVLGKIKVTNVAGQNLELQEFGVRITLTPGTSFEDLDNDNVDDGASEAAGLKEYLENVEFYNEDTGASYELTDPIGTGDTDHVYSDDDLNVELPQGSVTFLIRADVRDNIANFDTAAFDLTLDVGAMGANGGFYVVETEDDTEVTDITPSSLTWNQIDGSEAGAVVSVTPLADITAVRGSEKVVALQFEVEADEASDLVMDEASVYISNQSGGGDADNQNIAQISLYKGSVSDANMLDQVSGTKLASGEVTFDGFNVTIPAGDTKTFVVTVNIVDGTDATADSDYNAELIAVSLEDADNDDVDASGLPAVSARDITVTDVGEIVRTEDANNDDNEDEKTILGGTSAKVFSVDVSAINEDVDVETVVFTVDTDLTTAVTTASLYLGDTLIATNANSDISLTTITFDDLTTLIIPQENKELKLSLNTATIGYQKIGETILAATVTAVQLTDATGADSGKDVTVGVSSLAVTGTEFSIVPATLTPSVAQSLSSSNAQAKLTVTKNAGSNTVDASNTAPNVTINTLTFSMPGGNVAVTDYSLYADGNSGDAVVGAAAGANIEFDLTTMADVNNRTVSSSKTFVIAPTIASGDTASLTLLEDGIDYDVVGVAASAGITTTLTSELNLGTRSVD